MHQNYILLWSITFITVYIFFKENVKIYPMYKVRECTVPINILDQCEENPSMREFRGRQV